MTRSEDWDNEEQKHRVFKIKGKNEMEHIHDFVIKKDDLRCKICNKTREELRREW